MHWTLEGNHFQVTYSQFATILGFDHTETYKDKITIHDPPNDVAKEFMYDNRYDQPKGAILGTHFGLITIVC